MKAIFHYLEMSNWKLEKAQKTMEDLEDNSNAIHNARILHPAGSEYNTVIIQDYTYNYENLIPL